MLRLITYIMAQNQNTSTVKKNAVYYDKTQHENFPGKPLFQATKQYLNYSQTVKNEMWRVTYQVLVEPFC